MTVEQVLVYLLAATAGIFLFLGLAQALGDHPIRSRRRRMPDRPEDESLPTGPVEEPDVTPAWARPRKPETPASPAPADRTSAGAADVTGAGTATPLAEDPGLAAAASRAAAARPEMEAAAPPPALETDPEVAIVEEAMRTCLDGTQEELLAWLDSPLAPDQRPHVTIALHSLAGLARRTLGDASGALGCFEAGGRLLPDPGAERCPPGIAALSIPVARRLLEEVAGAPSQDEDGQDDGGRADVSVSAARLAAFWLSWRLDAAPGDQDTLALLDTAREAVARAHAEAVTGAIRRQEYGTARAIVVRAVDAGELPRPRGEVLLELLGVTFRREIDRLTAGAIRGGNDDNSAVSGLGQAEALFESMPEGAIGPAYRAAVAQRIWRAHSKLGFRRLGLGQLDAAADTLFHALAMRAIGRRRQRQVRDALVRTLEGLGDQQASALSTLLADGKLPAAAEDVARLERRVQRAREEGVSDEELEVAMAKLEQIRRRLDEATTVR